MDCAADPRESGTDSSRWHTAFHLGFQTPMKLMPWLDLALSCWTAASVIGVGMDPDREVHTFAGPPEDDNWRDLYSSHPEVGERAGAVHVTKGNMCANKLDKQSPRLCTKEQDFAVQ